MPQRPTGDTRGDHHAAMQQGLRWRVPRQFNIAQVCSRRWAQAEDASERIAEGNAFDEFENIRLRPLCRS